MLALTRWKIILVLVSAIFGILFTLPNLVPAGTLPSWMPNQRLNLGLDLQGGSYLLEEVDIATLRKERLTNITEDIRTKLRSEQILFTGLGLAGGQVKVTITDPSQVQTAYNLLKDQLGEQLLSGGRDVVVRTGPNQTITVSLAPQAAQAEAADAVSRSIEIIRKRIDALGTKEPIITQQGSNRIVIEAPGESDPERLKEVIGKTAKLTFQMVDTDVATSDIQAGHVPPDDQVLPSDDGFSPFYVVKRRAVVTGEMLTGASGSHDQDGNPSVAFSFNGEGTRRFAEVT
ncbi:MAG: SecDF P1 head subdomain-containing protein, partial [Caulobacteraceae bacterium]